MSATIVDTTAPRRVYLAGKIAAGDWRHKAVGGLRDSVTYHEFESEWPVLARSIFGRHDYVGPFFVCCNHGCYHGRGTHGSDPEGCSGLSPASLEGRDTIARRCRSAIDRSDLVYAWVDDPSAYGTILEIGYALGRGRRVVLAHPPGEPFYREARRAGARGRVGDGALGDLWLLPQFVAASHGCETLAARDPVTGLRCALSGGRLA